jgi:hypothetical protein
VLLLCTACLQIIHPARYYGIFRDWDGKRAYTKKELEARNGLTLYKGERPGLFGGGRGIAAA